MGEHHLPKTLRLLRFMDLYPDENRDAYVNASIAELEALVERQQRVIDALDKAGVQIVSAGGAWPLKDAALLDSSSVEEDS
jgi:hypothetical protein